MAEERMEQEPPVNDVPSLPVERSLATMLLHDAHGVIVDGVKVAVGIGIAKVLDRRNPPDDKSSKGDGGKAS